MQIQYTIYVKWAATRWENYCVEFESKPVKFSDNWDNDIMKHSFETLLKISADKNDNNYNSITVSHVLPVRKKKRKKLEDTLSAYLLYLGTFFLHFILHIICVHCIH